MAELGEIRVKKPFFAIAKANEKGLLEMTVHPQSLNPVNHLNSPNTERRNTEGLGCK